MRVSEEFPLVGPFKNRIYFVVPFENRTTHLINIQGRQQQIRVSFNTYFPFRLSLLALTTNLPRAYPPATTRIILPLFLRPSSRVCLFRIGFWKLVCDLVLQWLGLGFLLFFVSGLGFLCVCVWSDEEVEDMRYLLLFCFVSELKCGVFQLNCWLGRLSYAWHHSEASVAMSLAM